MGFLNFHHEDLASYWYINYIVILFNMGQIFDSVDTLFNQTGTLGYEAYNLGKMSCGTFPPIVAVSLIPSEIIGNVLETKLYTAPGRVPGRLIDCPFFFEQQKTQYVFDGFNKNDADYAMAYACAVAAYKKWSKDIEETEQEHRNILELKATQGVSASQMTQLQRLETFVLREIQIVKTVHQAHVIYDYGILKHLDSRHGTSHGISIQNRVEKLFASQVSMLRRFGIDYAV